MGIDRFEDSDEGPGQEAKADPSMDTGSPGNAHRPWEASESSDVGRAEEPAPDNPASRESPDTADAEARPAESRTRSEYADHLAPPNTPPVEDVPPNSRPEEPNYPDDQQHESIRAEEERSNGSSTEAAEGMGALANDSEESDELLPHPEDRAADQAEPQGHNYEITDNEQVKQSGDVGEVSTPGQDQEPQPEKVAHNILERLQKAHAADLATDHANTTDPDNKQWSAERNLIHGEIVRDLYNQAEAVPCEHKAIIAGGLPGAGKTTILAEQAGIDQSQYLTINPDKIKEVLANRDLIPEVEGLSPMEASDLAHEESSVIAKHLAHRAQAEGKNLIWDITMSRLESTQERIDSLHESGYEQIDAIFVDIPIEVSIKRTQARHREDQESWLLGRGLGGRFIPPEIIWKQADPEWGSKNKKTFENIKLSVNNWMVFDNSVDYRRAILADSNNLQKTSQNRQEKRPE